MQRIVILPSLSLNVILSKAKNPDEPIASAQPLTPFRHKSDAHVPKPKT